MTIKLSFALAGQVFPNLKMRETSFLMVFEVRLQGQKIYSLIATSLSAHNVFKTFKKRCISNVATLEKQSRKTSEKRVKNVKLYVRFLHLLEVILTFYDVFQIFKKQNGRLFFYDRRIFACESPKNVRNTFYN